MMWKAKDAEKEGLDLHEHHRRTFHMLQEMLRLQSMCCFDKLVEHEILEGHIYYLRLVLESNMEQHARLPGEEACTTRHRLNAAVAKIYAELARSMSCMEWDAEWHILKFASLRYAALTPENDLSKVEEYLRQPLQLVFAADAAEYVRVEVRQHLEQIRFFATVRYQASKLNCAIANCARASQKLSTLGSSLEDDLRMRDFFRREIEELFREEAFVHVDHECREALNRLFAIQAS